MFVPFLWIKEALIGLFRNFWWNGIAFMLALCCFGGLAFSFIAGENAEHLSSELEDRMEIQVDLAEDTSGYNQIRNELMDDDRIESVEFVSKEEALERMEGELGEDAVVLEIFEENIFPAQFIIHLEDTSQVGEVAQELQELPYAERVIYGQELIEQVLSTTETIQSFGFYIAVGGAVMAFFVVMFAIRMNIEQRKEEIRIKHLIGSGMLTIRMPFILEACIIMMLAATTVFYGFNFMYIEFEILIAEQALPISVLSSEEAREALIYPLYISALLLGVLGSLFTPRRHLKKK